MSEESEDAKFEADWIAARKGVNYFNMAHVLSARLRQMDKRAKAANKRADASQARLSEAVKVLERLANVADDLVTAANSSMADDAISQAKAFIATLGETK